MDGNFKLEKWTKLITSLINVFYPLLNLISTVYTCNLKKPHPNAYYYYYSLFFYDKRGKLVIEYNAINKNVYRPAYYTKNRYKKCIYCGRVEKNLTLDRLSKDKWVLSSQQEYDLHDSRKLIDLTIIDRDKKLEDLLGK